jgi:phosphate transport system ATP-binding protein
MTQALELEVRNLNFFYSSAVRALHDVSLPIQNRKVTALIGPSGCGKTTLLRCFNRMHDLYPRHRYEGEIIFEGRNILSDTEDLIKLRSRIGMVFQKPTPFPMSIAENIAYGLRLKGIRIKSELVDRIERALKQAALWDEVRGKLNNSAYDLS